MRLHVYRNTDKDGIVRNLFTGTDYGNFIAEIEDEQEYEKTKTKSPEHVKGATIYERYSTYMLMDNDALVNDAEMDLNKIHNRNLKKHYS